MEIVCLQRKFMLYLKPFQKQFRFVSLFAISYKLCNQHNRKEIFGAVLSLQSFSPSNSLQLLATNWKGNTQFSLVTSGCQSVSWPV